ncbi:MAG: MFS transporter [Candidatus Sumerlaeaceae bacterium]|nr:MFS transporter [Candidatus Sumerlaeaceae bacterium]
MQSESSPKSLKGFWALIAAQFQAAFNDTCYKQLLTVIATYEAVSEAEGNKQISIISGVFILPFLLFSMYGGYFADRFSKRSVAITTKSAEILIMILGALAFYSHHLAYSIAVLGLMGIHSAFFGPAKYGIIPELVPEKKISWANGYLELTTFVAIIGGTWAGGQLYSLFKGNLQFGMMPLICLSVVGAFCAWQVTKVPPRAPNRVFKPNFLADVWRYMQYSMKDRVLWLAVLGNSFWWFVAALVLQNNASFAKQTMHLNEVQLGYLMVSMAVGIGLGSVLAGYLSSNKIEYGFIPLGALLMAIFGIDLSRPGLSLHHVLFSLSILGFGAGFFIVPVQALVQQRPDAANKGGVQGMAYFLSNLGVLLAAVAFWVLTDPKLLGLKPPQVFLVGSLVTLGVAAYICYLLPDSIIRLGLWFLSHTIYRLRIVGRDNIPEHGGALFCSNHVSFVDVLFIIASTDRHVRFIMDAGIYNRPLMKPLARIMRAIPISGESGPRALIQAMRTASKAVRDGEVVCIFPEGQITRTGQLLPFRRGFERIMKGVDAPIIPIHLDRLWGSIFSFEKGRFLWKMPHKIPYPVTISYGAALAGSTPTSEVRRDIQELGTEAAKFRRDDMRPLHREFISIARQHPRRFAMADGMTPHVSFFGALVRSIVLARRLKGRWQGQEMVGLLMPPSVAGACLNFGATMAGHVPVNLNYTVSQGVLDSCVAQCNIKTIVTARAFIERIKVAPSAGAIYIEDLATEITLWDKISATIGALLFPARLLEKLLGASKVRSLDDLATVIFSSGSTGDPKGVMLSHYNVISNVEGVSQVMGLGRADRLLGILPFFHSFGFTGTLWFPATRGNGVVFHPNPMDARTIGGLVAKYRVTLMVATPTFLQSYIRRVEPGMFGSLRFVLVGAEKLPERVAQAFEDRFGIRPYEAYGTTECAPAVTVNVPGYRAAGFYQVGGKREHIGHPLPGVTVQIVDPDTLAPMPVGKPGLLPVKGPNVMMGYLGKPEKTAEVLREGWYVTGDIAAMDEDGFLVVTDRLSRFSKIGGEMVPHIKVEEALHELAGATEQKFVVTALPDEKKGERLVVLHTLDAASLESVLEKLSSSGLPNLWIPRRDSFHYVEAIPILGTGKTDLRGVKELAAKLAA